MKNKQVLTEPPIIAYPQNRNLQDILAMKTIASNKKLCQSIDQNGYSHPCNSKLSNLYCTQVQSTNSFKSTVTQKTFKTYTKLIFLIEIRSMQG